MKVDGPIPRYHFVEEQPNRTVIASLPARAKRQSTKILQEPTSMQRDSPAAFLFVHLEEKFVNLIRDPGNPHSPKIKSFVHITLTPLRERERSRRSYKRATSAIL